MTRTRQPRGAAAKTKAAIKREARADKASAYRRAVVAADAQAEADHRSVTRRPSILDELAANPPRPRWTFTDEQLADVHAVFDAVDAGTIACGCGRLAQILKQRYDLPWAVDTIRTRLLEIHRSR